MKKIMFILSKLSLILILGIVFCSWSAPEEKPQQQKRKKLMILCSAHRTGEFGYKSADDSVRLMNGLYAMKEKAEMYKDIYDLAKYYGSIENINNGAEDRLVFTIDNMVDSLLLINLSDLPFSNDLGGYRHYDVTYSSINHFSEISEDVEITKYNTLNFYNALWDNVNPAYFDEFVETTHDAQTKHRDGSCIVKQNQANIFNSEAVLISWYYGDNEYTKQRFVSKELIDLNPNWEFGEPRYGYTIYNFERKICKWN